MKKFLPSFLIALVLLMGVNKFVLAEGTNVNLTVKNNGDVVYVGSIALLPAGTISISDSSGNPHDTDADSVLSIVNTADASSAEFDISNLIYYDSFSAFYLKCISVSGSELCDNWQYKVDDASPNVGMDSKILAGGESVVLYFGDENKAPEPEPEPTPAPEPELKPTHSNGGGGGYAVLNPVSIPAPLPASPAPAPLPLNTNLVEEPKIQTVAVKTPKKIAKKIKPKSENAASQNTATAINAVSQTPPITQTEVPKKNWLRRLLENIFSVF